VALWQAQHIGRYVSIDKSRATLDHGLRHDPSSETVPQAVSQGAWRFGKRSISEDM
jgi:hypothetical protein